MEIMFTLFESNLEGNRVFKYQLTDRSDYHFLKVFNMNEKEFGFIKEKQLIEINFDRFPKML